MTCLPRFMALLWKNSPFCLVRSEFIVIFHANCSRFRHRFSALWSHVSCSIPQFTDLLVNVLPQLRSRKVHWPHQLRTNSWSWFLCMVTRPILGIQAENGYESRKWFHYSHPPTPVHPIQLTLPLAHVTLPSNEILPKRRFTSFKLALTASSSWTSEAMIQEVNSKLIIVPNRS